MQQSSRLKARVIQSLRSAEATIMMAAKTTAAPAQLSILGILVAGSTAEVTASNMKEKMMLSERTIVTVDG